MRCIMFVVKDEDEAYTMAMKEEGDALLDAKCKAIAEKIVSLKGICKKRFEDSPEEFIFKHFSDEEYEKCIYACMSKKDDVFSVYSIDVIIAIESKLMLHLSHLESDREQKKQEAIRLLDERDRERAAKRRPYIRFVSGGLPSLGKRR